MTKAFLIASTAFLALGSVANAQTAAPTTTANDATITDSPTAAPMPDAPAPAADSAISTAQAQPGSSPDATAPVKTVANGTTAAAVQAEWAKYDKGNKGSLTPLEFGEWVMAANGQDIAKQVAGTRTSKKAGLPAVKVLNATAGAFAKADTNKDRAVSPDELTTFLNG